MAQETRLCGACRKHTLQTLYKGTRLYSLGTGCSLCELIRPEVVSYLGLSDGDELPEIRLRVVDEERDSYDMRLLSIRLFFHEIARHLKERVWGRFPRTYDSFKMREHPFGRLQVLTPGYDIKQYLSTGRDDVIEITQLKAAPLEGRSLNPHALIPLIVTPPPPLIPCLAHGTAD